MKNTRKKLNHTSVFKLVGFGIVAAMNTLRVAAANPYNLSLLTGEWFNTEILNTQTTAGVLFYFFIFIVYVGMIVLSEHTKMPAFMFLSGLLGFFIGLLFYVIISAVIGVIFIVIAVIYMIRSIAFANEK